MLNTNSGSFIYSFILCIRKSHDHSQQQEGPISQSYVRNPTQIGLSQEGDLLTHIEEGEETMRVQKQVLATVEWL